MLSLAGMHKGSLACDVGAGVAHLTLKLLDRGLNVVAVEPNDAMRANGKKRTAKYADVVWYEGTGEQTGQPSSHFDLVTFGSSFNVTNRPAALKESRRILKKDGCFACMWNHRDLSDRIQTRIESIITARIPGYDYGTRREDQTEVINASGLFGKVSKIVHSIVHKQSVADCVEAWRSHATLQRQAGEAFPVIVEEIDKMLMSLGQDTIDITYQTNVWIARART